MQYFHGYFHRKINILLHKTNLITQTLKGQLSHIFSVNRNLSTCYIVKSWKQGTNCCLATSRRTNQRNDLARISHKCRICNNTVSFDIRKIHIPHLHLEPIFHISIHLRAFWNMNFFLKLCKLSDTMCRD